MDDVTRRNQVAYETHADEWRCATRTNETYHFLEKPAMEALLPHDLTGKTVLCIGAGSGEELAALLARNPRAVTALDLSETLLAHAQTQYPEVRVMCMDMMALSFERATFDLVYASLAFHYAPDWDALLAGVHRVLKPGGVLLFSTHHPRYWSKHPTGASRVNARGVKLTEHTATLPGGVAVTYYNHTGTAAIDDALNHAGFAIVAAQTPAVVSILPQTLHATERKRYENLRATNSATPLFYIVLARTCI